MSKVPIKYSENLSLTTLGVKPANISFAYLTIESEKCICICDRSPEGQKVEIIYVTDQPTKASHNMNADSARMNPSHNIIALKSEKAIQVYDYAKKRQLKSLTFTEEVVFWRWISSDTIAYITASSVYHWSTNDDSQQPTKIFDRTKTMPGSQIISYKVDSTKQWCAVVEISNAQGQIVGMIQLYSAARKLAQQFEGFACAFTDVVMEGNLLPSKVFALVSRAKDVSRLSIIELSPTPPNNAPFPKNQVAVMIPPDVAASGDFPFSMHYDKRSGIIFIITKIGYMYLYELETAECIFANRISPDLVFASADLLNGDGFIAVNRRGSVFTISIDPDAIVPYLMSKRMETVAYKLAVRAGYAGAEGLIVNKFNEYFNNNQFVEAARVAARTTCTSLRNAQTMARFKAASSSLVSGIPSPIVVYFTTLTEHGKLNAIESIEFCMPLLQTNNMQYVKKWLQDDKLECTEELGDLVHPVDIATALSIYLHAKAHACVVKCFAEMGNFADIIKYAEKVHYIPDYLRILRSLCVDNPEAAENFGKTMLHSSLVDIDISKFASCFIESKHPDRCISFLVEALKANDPIQADLQTKLLELALMYNPAVAQTILTNKILTHFDKPHVAKLCEQAGLIHHALEYYTDIYDIQRAITQSQNINPEWLVSYFGSLSVDDTLSCLKVLLDHNRRQNITIVVKVATKYHDQLTDIKLIQLFENAKSIEGLFMFLSAVVNLSQDAEVHFKYIQATVKMGQMNELVRICKESNCFDPEKVKNFLKEAKLADQTALTIVCDRFDFVDDLVRYFHKNDLLRAVQVYANRVNPSRMPKIVGALLDVGCSEEFIRTMMLGCPPEYSMSALVAEVTQRNRINLIQHVIEARVAAGSVDPEDHSALAIVYINNNNRPESFLRDNHYYDPLVVGKYCESRDAKMACIAYENGKLDQEMIDVCVNNLFFKILARYVIQRADEGLWAKVLDASNDYRRSIIEQASQSVFSESYDPQYISEMVRAFMGAHLSLELIDLLEKIVFGDSPHKGVRSLQNLLLLTAIKFDRARVLDFINRLDNYDAPNIASSAIDQGLFEEAFCIYKKFDEHPSAVQILSERIGNIDRAYEYAEKCNVPQAWSILGRAQLAHKHPRKAIDSFIKAEDYSLYLDVIKSAASANIHDVLVKYLTMVRANIRDSTIDSEYAYCLAYLRRFDQLGEFLKQPHHANIIAIGDRLFNEEQYEAAKVFYQDGTNFPKLAATHVKLQEYQQAVEMARKANNTKMWKLVCTSCLTAGEYKFAQVCALNLVVHPEELEELSKAYENLGLYQELVNLIEASVNLERSHMGIFTELAILYAKYKPARLREHLELYYTRITIPRVIKVAESYQMWSEIVFLHDKYEEYDNAINTMICHPSAAFNEPQFREIVQKITNQELFNKAIAFYYDFKPLMLNDLMIVFSPRIDHAKAIAQLKSLSILPICKSYLTHVQHLNMPIINEALNAIFIEEEAYDDLSASIEQYDNFDSIKLSDELSQHPSIEMRRISTRIRKLSNRWGQTLEMAMKDKLFDEAIFYASASRDPSIAQSLLEKFIDLKRPDLLVSLMYFCYDILSPDDVLEACWLNGMSDFCMPYLIQTMRDFNVKIETLERECKKKDDNTNDHAHQTDIYTSPPQLMIGASHPNTHFSPPSNSRIMPTAVYPNQLAHNPFK